MQTIEIQPGGIVTIPVGLRRALADPVVWSVDPDSMWAGVTDPSQGVVRIEVAADAVAGDFMEFDVVCNNGRCEQPGARRDTNVMRIRVEVVGEPVVGPAAGFRLFNALLAFNNPEADLLPNGCWAETYAQGDLGLAYVQPTATNTNMPDSAGYELQAGKILANSHDLHVMDNENRLFWPFADLTQHAVNVGLEATIAANIRNRVGDSVKLAMYGHGPTLTYSFGTNTIPAAADRSAISAAFDAYGQDISVTTDDGQTRTTTFLEEVGAWAYSGYARFHDDLNSGFQTNVIPNIDGAVREMVRVSQALYERLLGTSRELPKPPPVYVYVWPQYSQSSASIMPPDKQCDFIDAVRWVQILDTIKAAGANGAVLWGGFDDEDCNGGGQQWSYVSGFPWWPATQAWAADSANEVIGCQEAQL